MKKVGTQLFRLLFMTLQRRQLALALRGYWDLAGHLSVFN